MSCAVFVANHGRAARERNASQPRSSGICAPEGVAIRTRRSSVGCVAEVALVADVDGIPLAAFDVLRDILAADAGFDGALNVFDGQAVAGGLQAIDIDVEVEALRDTLRKNRARVSGSRDSSCSIWAPAA